MPPVKKVTDQPILVETSAFPSYAKFNFDKFNVVQSRVFEFYNQNVNLVVAAATGVGKTLVGEMMASAQLRERGGKVIYLAPMKALAKEKYEEWTDEKHHFHDLKISICTGDYRLTPARQQELNEADIIILTSEMLNSRTRNMKSENNDWLKEVAVCVVDECFPYNTKIKIASDIEVDIGKIVEDESIEQVYSYDYDTKSIILKKILRRIKKERNCDLIRVKHDFGSFVCTVNHKIWTENRGYVVAECLLENDILKRVIRSTHNITATSKVKNTRKWNKKGIEYVYDLEVEDNHNYFANGVLVSNCHLLTVPGRGDHLEVGLMNLTSIGADVRFVLLSATMPNVDQIADWVSYVLTGKETYLLESKFRPCPLGIHYETYDTMGGYQAQEENKVEAALNIIADHPDDKFLIFAHTKTMGQLMKTAMTKAGYEADFHSADLDKNGREKLESRFKDKNGLQYLIATSTLAWGCYDENTVVLTPDSQFVFCVKNDNYTDLTPRKTYKIKHDANKACNLLRVIDDSGDDCLYPADLFGSIIDSKWIKDVKVGDEIFSLNKDNEFEVDKVVKTGCKFVDYLYQVVLENGDEANVSENHEFYSKKGENTDYHKMTDLNVGDLVATIDFGENKQIEYHLNNEVEVFRHKGQVLFSKIKLIKKLNKKTKVFDLEVEKNHNFIGNGMISHNCNTPARRVIILGVHRGIEEVASYDIHQSIGRSGRPGYDPRGDAYILLPENREEKYRNKLKTPENIESRLLDNVGGHYKTLAFHLVSEIHHGKIKNKEDVMTWYERTLAHFQAKAFDDDLIDSTMDLLLKCGAIKEENGIYKVTVVGMVSSMFYYSPFDVADLRRNFMGLFNSHKEADDIALSMALGNVDSLRMGFVSRAEKEDMGLFATKVIREFGKETFLETAMKGGCAYFAALTGGKTTGLMTTVRTLQWDFPRLIQVLSGLDSMGCKWNKGTFFKELQSRVVYGVNPELVCFVKLPDIGKVRAERLYALGFRTLKDIVAKPDVVASALNFKADKVMEIVKVAKSLILVS